MRKYKEKQMSHQKIKISEHPNRILVKDEKGDTIGYMLAKRPNGKPSIRAGDIVRAPYKGFRSPHKVLRIIRGKPYVVIVQFAQGNDSWRNPIADVMRTNHEI